MSTKLDLATAAFALAVASLAAPSSALAQSRCDGQWHTSVHSPRTYQCYYLPTVAGGRVTGVAQHMNLGPDPRAWHHGWGQSSSSCRYLPTVAGGRVVGSHQVCG
jgi:hypothetical protein